MELGVSQFAQRIAIAVHAAFKDLHGALVIFFGRGEAEGVIVKLRETKSVTLRSAQMLQGLSGQSDREFIADPAKFCFQAHAQTLPHVFALAKTCAVKSHSVADEEDLAGVGAGGEIGG